MSTEAQKKASKLYNEKCTTQINLKFNNNTDKDIVERLEEVKKSGQSVRSYILTLIRNDIKK